MSTHFQIKSKIYPRITRIESFPRQILIQPASSPVFLFLRARGQHWLVVLDRPMVLTTEADYRETGELFRDLRSTESKLITGSPPPKPAARSPRDASSSPNYGHPNVTVTSPSVGGLYQPGYASRLLPSSPSEMH